MYDRPILFYSEYCIHSKNFLNALMKHQELFDLFIRINIDVDITTKQRPNVFYNIQRELGIKIKEIPTIITPGPENILTGADAFDWLDFQTKSLSKESVEGFNCIEMGSFSDSYSTYGSSDLNDAKQQTFKFIGKNDDKIETPPETTPETTPALGYEFVVTVMITGSKEEAVRIAEKVHEILADELAVVESLRRLKHVRYGSSVGNDGRKRHEEILASLAGGHAGRNIACYVLNDFWRNF